MYDFSPSPEQQRVIERVRALMDELVYPNESSHALPISRLKQLHDAAPERDLEIRVRPGGDEFDGGFFRLRLGKLGEENGGIVRTP